MAGGLENVAVKQLDQGLDVTKPDHPHTGSLSPRKRKNDDRGDQPSELQDFLHRTKLSDMCKEDQKLVVLEHNNTVSTALKELALNNILSAPLVVAPDLEDLVDPDSSNADQYAAPSLLGWVDVHDILRAFLRHLEEGEKPIPTKMLQLMTILEHEGPRFANKPLVTIMGGYDKGLVYQANSSSSLLETIRDMFLKQSGPGEDPGAQVTHRLAIFDAHGYITHIVSQLDVIRFLLNNAKQLGPLVDQTVEELGMLAGKPPVTTVDPHEPTLLAYKKMLADNVQGAAVVCADGQLITNLSISDLRCIQPQHFGVLALPVAEFLALMHHTTYVGYSVHSSGSAKHPFFVEGDGQKRSRKAAQPDVSPTSVVEAKGDGPLKPYLEPITCTVQATLRQVLELLVENHIHRVYVVDKLDKPHAIAVVTPTDVMRVISGVW
ncbi:hypothetical protein WJX72_011551 [[Myrmecia] bisecta]|uniref:CBS domain-containing protein n=1 Tax=[Myrmecia] bisecta TaxID=41462 RepID=A0AAW1Q7V0_9CHLO